MKLTPAQARQLEASIRLRTTPPTVWWYFRSSWRTYAYLTALYGIGIAAFIWAGWPLVSAFFAGFLFAAISRDLKLFGQFVRGWPLSNEITNWGRVDELLAQAKQDAT